MGLHHGLENRDGRFTGTAAATARPRAHEKFVTKVSNAWQVVGGSGWQPLATNSVSKVLRKLSQSAAFQFNVLGGGVPVGTTEISM